MKTITGPKGFEISRAFCDGTRSFRVFARPTGATWWTDCGIVGHCHMPEAQVDRLAFELAETWISMGMVK